ncbi:predicted protein, partial [Nematostella vectensis]
YPSHNPCFYIPTAPWHLFTLPITPGFTSYSSLASFYPSHNPWFHIPSHNSLASYPSHNP